MFADRGGGRDSERRSGASRRTAAVIYVPQSEGGEMDHRAINQFGAFHHSAGSESTAPVICGDISLP